ncbi:MAG: PSD1 and planctomycete cytochrome C domain-containing protein [Verrucomicrobiota bacterium]
MPVDCDLRGLFHYRCVSRSVVGLLCFVVFLATPDVLAGGGPDFQHVVQPILNEHCAECHGGVKKSSGFSVLSRQMMLTPGDSGEPGLVPGHSANSVLFQRIVSGDLDDRMPPEGHDPLTAQQIQDLKEWIHSGAEWPSHWAFISISRAQVPKGKHPVDYFIEHRLSEEGIDLSPSAGGAVLMRRLGLDLIGLLPDEAQLNRVGELVSDSQYEQHVDALLTSPHFGERWGRHWLDEARYADSLGYEKDSVKEDAWRYRDWVVGALNADMPFDQFSRSQLAGDLLETDDPAVLIATKLHLQTQFNLEGGIDAEEDRVKRVMDRVNMVGSSWLGLTVGCAQCHDHPYDDFSQKDYYSLVAYFNNMDFDASFLTEAPEGADAILKERATLQDQLQDMLQRQVHDKNLNNQTVGQLVKLFRFDASNGLTRHMRERTKDRRETFVLLRGDFLRPDLQQGALSASVPSAFQSDPSFHPQANRLDLVDWMFSNLNPLTARVMVNKVWMHLMGRPLVDTVQDFGNRGSRPTHPELLDWLSDWWMKEGGWSLKRLIRFIVTSDTYRQSSIHRPELKDIDPDNRLFARQNRFRVEAEILRDISLQVSGLLSFDVGGPSVFPPIPDVVLSQSFTPYRKKSTGRDRYRRGIYTFFRRTAMDPNLTVFDCPDASASTAVRDRSNNALQAMTTLNNEVFVEAAQAFSVRLLSDTETIGDHYRISKAFLVALHRQPEPEESEALVKLLESGRSWYEKREDEAKQLVGPHHARNVAIHEQAAWVHVTRLILNLDAFLTRE